MAQSMEIDNLKDSSSGVVVYKNSSKDNKSSSTWNKVSGSDINNRESMNLIEENYVSFRNGGLATVDNPLKIQDLNSDVFENEQESYHESQVENYNISDRPAANHENMNSSVIKMDPKLDEKNIHTIYAMRDKIKSMIEFYESSQ